MPVGDVTNTGTRANTQVAAPELGALIEECYPRIRRAAFVLTGSDADADDLAQETVLQALRSIGRFEGRSRIHTWFYGILLNQERRLRRSQQRRARLETFLERWLHLSANGRRSEPNDAEWMASLWRQVALLPCSQRDCVFLRYSEGLSCETIAEVLGCPVGTVKSRIHYGLAALKGAVEGKAEG